jgi:ribosome-binding factor A
MTLHSREKRLAEEIKAALAEILALELKDPRLHQGMLTVSHVDLSKDLRNATVWVSLLGGGNADEALEGLRHSKGFIKRLLGERVVMRYMPEFAFKFDHSFEHADRVNRLLKQVTGDGPPATEPQAPPAEPDETDS